MSDPASRRKFLVIVLLFGVALIGTAIFGWVVVQNVRKTADRTDLEMRAIAWASIVFACEHEGRYPIDEEELLSVQPLPEQIPCTPTGDESWPVTREEALGGAEPPALEPAFTRMEIYFSSDGALPPAIRSGGLPMLLDTQDTILDWLGSFRFNADEVVK